MDLDILAHGATQAKRSSRITSSRSFGTNVKQTSSNGVNFDCPEEFGYYPHPTDCTQYYVCVFGGALLESCTGGLMYSHELQTCDWPRNVGCEVVDSGTSASTATGLRGDVGSQKKKQQSVPNQHVPSRVRFGSAFTSPGSTTQQPRPTVPQQYHRQPPQQIIQAQVQTIPPPPELRVPPNPVVTSRGQPKHLIDSQEEIAKLYADSDSLPPVEEEESDRQQRVYRGQPSTVSQVQRDRDGIIHQASINAIPNHGKIGSFAFGSQYRKHLIDERLDDGIKTRKLVRHKRELSLIEQEANTETTKTTEATRTETTFKTKEILTETHKPTEQSNATHIQNFNDLVTNREGPERIGTADDVSNTSQEIMDDDVMDITTPVNGDESNTAKEMVEENSDDDGEDAVVGESVRASRQLRPFGNARARWPVHTPVGVTNYRSIDASPYQQQTAYSFGPFNPFLTPPAKQNYQQLSPGYQFYPQTQPQHHQQLLQQDPQKQKSKVVYTGYNLSLPPPPVQDDFRPIAGNFYGPTATTTKRPNYVPHSELLPYIIQSLQELKDQRKKAQAENFSYFHLENPAGGKSQQTTTTMPYYQSQAPKQPLKVTPNSHYSPYSTVGGFYNNQAEQQRPQVDFQPTTQYPIKLISQFSIKDASNHNILPTTTESNYFKYNILANQKMKGFYSTAKASAYDDTTYKPISVKLTTARPPATNINIVSAPNLAAYRPDFTNYPAGIIYANTSSTQPESYQTFTSKVAATEAPKIKSTPVKPKVNLQFNIPDFVSNLQPSDLAGLNPTVMNMLKYFKQVGVTDKTKVARRPISSTSIAPVNLNQNEYEVTTARPRYRTRLPATTAAPTTTTFRTPTTTTATRPAPRPVKGYESFIKSIPKQSTKFRPSNSITTTYNNHNYAHDGDEYYDEYEEGEDESLGNDSDDQIRPPSQMPPYVPMSETMAPPRPHLIPPSPTTPQPKSNAVISNNKQNNYITGYFEATTARRPYFGADFQQFYQNGNGLANAPAKGTAQQNNQIPSFINFPTDFFQEIKQRLPQLHEGTTKRYNLQTATTPTPRPYTTTTISPPSTTPTPRPTTTTTSRTRYTLRPNLNQNRNRRPGKWPHNSTQTLDFGLPSFSRKRPASASSTAELGAVQLNVNMNLDMDSHSHRIESSSPTSQTPSAANLYVQPPRPNQLIVETIPSNRNQQQNRNYYNTSSLSHDYGGGYVASPPQSSSNIQHQQQQVPLQHHQQQQQSAQNEQSSYDTYYSVYDDDIDLYRDLEYQQQQQQQQQQQHQQQQPNHQTHYTQQRQPQQSSYRPLEIVTTPTPQQVPLRETYSNKPHNTERPAYNDQQSLIYNTDYDDDLIAQIEQDNVYDQPTRPPTRSEQVTIGALQDQPQPSSIQPSALGKDKRNYYSTLTTELPPTSVADEIAPVSYSYETSAEYAEVPEYYTTITERTPLYKKPTRFSTYAPKLVNTQESDEYNIIGSTLLEETTDAFDLTTNTLNPTTKNLKYSTAQNSNSAFAKSSSTTTAALAASLWTTSTATTTTTTTTPKSTTHKSTTQIVKTTTPATSTKAIRSEKQHAKEIPKNQLPKLPAQAQHTSSLNPLDSPTQQPTDKSRSEPLITFVAQTQSHSAQILQHTFKTSEPAHQREAAHEARSLASTEESETVSDESQNVHVKSAEKPRRDRKYSAEYATSPHGNLIDLNTNKPYRGKSAEELNKEARKNSGERDYISIGNTVNEKQRPRLQDFVVSDVEPQSFKPPATELAAASTTTETPLELVSSASSSTTTLRYLPAAAMVGNVPQPFKYSLQTGLHGFSLRAQNQTAAAIEETSQPIYERKPTSHPAFTSTTSQVSSMPFYKQQILPTTYAPPLRWWQNGRPKIMHAEERDHVKTAGSERQLITTAEAQTTSTSTTTATPTATRKSTPPPSSTTERPVQSFTARASVFKDTLSKTTGSPAGRYVSPYKSLENILQEKDERFGYNSIRTTAKPRYTSSASSPPPTSKPFRSYFLITSAPKNMTENLFANMPSTLRNFSVSDAILSNFSSIPTSTTPATTTTTTTTERMTTESTSTESTTTMTMSTVVATSPIRIEQSGSKMGDFGSSGGGLTRGRSRYTAATEPTTYAPRPRWPVENLHARLLNGNSYRRKVQRARIAALQNQRQSSGSGKYQSYKTEHQQREVHQKILKRKPHENEANEERTPRAEALVALPIDHNQENSLENYQQASGESTEQVISATERPPKFLYSNKYRQQTAEHTLADSLQNAGYLSTSTGRSKLVPTTVLEQLQLFLAGDSEESSSQQQFVDNFSEREITAAVKEIKNLYTSSTTAKSVPTTTTTTTLRPTTTPTPPTVPYYTSTTLRFPTTTSTTTMLSSTTPATQTNKFNSYNSNLRVASDPSPSSTTSAYSSSTSTQTPSSLLNTSTAKTPLPMLPMRASRVNNAIKTSIAAAYASSASATPSPAVRSNNKLNGLSNTAAAVKCSDSTSNAKCNEIPTRTNANSNRNRGSAQYAHQDRDLPASSNRGTHPPRTRPTLKPSGTIVSKAQEFVDIYKNLPARPEPLYPQPTPDKTAAKCRRDVCLLPDCYCGGRDIPGGLTAKETPQTVLITFDDAVSQLNIELYEELFNNETRKNPNGCPLRATFYVSHEWTDYGYVQDLYSDGHEMASHTVSHSFGEQFSQKKWTREVAGQREILAAYGGVKLDDVRGMRAPFLSVGGNKMYKMLYDANFTYDSSMPVYENRPPSWPYTLDYKIFHDCMIPPCPTRSYPGVWQVPMVMWQDLNGGRCSMGDACSNPSESDGVYKMIMKNFERHYTTNRAPFGLFYHAAWFTQPHHKEGFIKFLDAINQMPDVWIITNWQMLQWVRDPTPISRINSFQPFQCDYSDRPKRCNNPKVCNLWHKSGVRYMKTCQPCPDIYPWTGKTGIRSSRIDNYDIEESTT